jgi:hypothetical protein
MQSENSEVKGQIRVMPNPLSEIRIVESLRDMHSVGVGIEESAKWVGGKLVHSVSATVAQERVIKLERMRYQFALSTTVVKTQSEYADIAVKDFRLKVARRMKSITNKGIDVFISPDEIQIEKSKYMLTYTSEFFVDTELIYHAIFSDGLTDEAMREAEQVTNGRINAAIEKLYNEAIRKFR